MPNPHDDNHHSFPIHSINHAVVTDSNSKVVGLPFEFLTSRRKWIVAEDSDFLRDSSLHLTVQRAELPQCRGREF
jgi:hypothetical protein